jgi:lipid-A-disaccharide synthase
MPVGKKSDCYFIAAGEHSGDLLGADLIISLCGKIPKCTPFGITGQTMQRAGAESVASISELSVMGVVEVLKKLPDLKMLESRILQRIDQRQPRFAVLIDNPGFNLRLAEQLKLRGIPVFQYVAPKLWAWGAKRASRLKRDIDTVLGILPFEEEFFVSRGVNYVYVGSPQKDRIEKIAVNRTVLGLKDSQTLVACLPGSRESELRFILPMMVRIRELLRASTPDAEFVVPVAPNLNWDVVASCLASAGVSPNDIRKCADGDGLSVPSMAGGGLRFIKGMSLELMAAADVALVASGTATLECGLLGTPMVVIYATNALIYALARPRVKLSHVSLINLVARRGLVNEYIQNFSLQDVATDLSSLLHDQGRRQLVKREFEELRDQLKGHAAESAAAVIADRCI